MRRAPAAFALAALLAAGCGGGGGGAEGTAAPPGPAAAAPASPASTVPVPAATPAPAPSPAATPAATAAPAAAAPAATPAAQPPEAGALSGDRGAPYSIDDLAAALAPGRMRPSDRYEPSCPGASVAGAPFALEGAGAGGRFAVWVLWAYPDAAALAAEWRVAAGQAPGPLLDGCEPPNGFVYWHENLLLWFAGFYEAGGGAAGAPPAAAAEVREHAVVRAFLGLTP